VDSVGQVQWLTSVILATWEVEIRRIDPDQGQAGQKVSETPSQQIICTWVLFTCSTSYTRDWGCREEDHSLSLALGKNVKFYLKKITKAKKDWDVAWVVEHLPSMGKILCSIPSTTKKKRHKTLELCSNYLWQIAFKKFSKEVNTQECQTKK
jgi:hypothetical protein